MRTVLTIAVSLLFSVASYALTLQEAVELALQNDDVIKKQQALLESSEYSKNAALSAFLPKAGVEYGYTHSKTFDDIPQYERDSKEANFAINVSYNLFNGFNDYKTYQMSASSRDVQQLKFGGAKQDIALTVKSAYLKYLETRSQVNVEKETVELLKKQKNTAEISFAVGQMSRADVLKVDVELASSELNLLNAQIAFSLARQSLERYIGRQLEANEDVEEVEIIDYDIPEINVLYNMLEENRSELKALKLSYDIASMAEQRSWSGFMPKVDAKATWGWYGDDFNAFDDRTGGYDRNEAYGIALSWNLFNGFYDHNTRKALAKDAMATSLDISDTRKTLRLQTSSAYETYFSAGERLKAAEVSVEYAKENYRITLTQYENSEATTTDLLDASVSLNRAQNSYASARYGLIDAVATIERAVEGNFMNINYNEPDYSY